MRAAASAPSLGIMRGRTHTVIAALILGLAVGAAPAAQAGVTQASTPLGGVSLEIDDATFEVSGCIQIPVDADVSTVNSEIYWNIDVEARLDGTATVNSAFMYGSGSGLEEDSIQICPFMDGAGKWLVTAELTLTDYGSDLKYTTELTTSFMVKKAKTTIGLSRITSSTYSMEFTGTIKSRSAAWGVVGVPGAVSIQLKKGRKWSEVGTGYADGRGKFVATVYDRYPKKSVFRAVYPGDESTLGSRSKQKRF